MKLPSYAIAFKSVIKSDQDLIDIFRPLQLNHDDHSDTIMPFVTPFFIERIFLFKGRARAFEKYKNMPLTEHKRRLKSISVTANRLQKLLSDEPFRDSLLYPDKHPDWDDLIHVDYLYALQAMLPEIASNSSRLSADDNQMRIKRQNTDCQCHMERILLWEPYFELAFKSAGTIKAAREGIVFKAITALHRVVGLPEPKDEAVYPAIRAYRAKKKLH